jgi:hypothetical protein
VCFHERSTTVEFKNVDILKKIVGGHVRELRKKLGYATIDAWSEALGVHPNSVGEFERGANWLSPEMLEKMISKTDLPMAAFFPGAELVPKEISGAPEPTLADVLAEVRSLKKLSAVPAQVLEPRAALAEALASLTLNDTEFQDIALAIKNLSSGRIVLELPNERKKLSN